MKILKNIVLLVALVSSYVTLAAASEVRIDLTPYLVHEPLQFKSLDNYILNLCIYRSLFEKDMSNNPTIGIIKKWRFLNKTGFYLLKIDERARWSDGSRISSDQIIKNIKRAYKVSINVNNSLKEIIDISKIEKIDDKAFRIKIKSGLPSKEFFLRMSSVFMSITHPKDWGKDMILKRNFITNGPYKISKLTNKKIILVRNKYDFLSPSTAPDKVTIRRMLPNYSIESFINEKTWTNIHIEASLVFSDLINKIKDKKIPYWTHGLDRVALLRPLDGKAIKTRTNILELLAPIWQKEIKKVKLPRGSMVADSLQPIGYPLFETLNYSQNTKKIPRDKVLKIVSYENMANRFLSKIIDKSFKKLGFKSEWVFKKDLVDFLDIFSKSNEYDYSLFSVGVSGIDVVTWISLALDSDYGFVHVSKEQKMVYKRIIDLHGEKRSLRKYRMLLKNIGESGGYLPLVHYSTLVLGHKTIDFSNVKRLDDTINISKIIFK